MKKKNIIITIVVLLVIAIISVLYFVLVKPLNDAKSAYNNAVFSIETKNIELEDAISKLQALTNSENKPIDETLIDSANKVIKEAEQNKVLVENMPSSINEIKAKTEELKNTTVDYTTYFQEMTELTTNLSNSIEAYKKFMNPTSEYIISKLANVDDIKNSEAVTEDNDPNGQLNKPGGYTSDVYFESKNVNLSKVYGVSLMEKGTQAGGSIEVYANEEDANKRNIYLASFDGTILSSGSHRVLGTTVIRTSDKLTVTQQKDLEAKIIEAMSK